MKQFTGICRDKRSTPSGPSGRERAPEEGDDILRTFKVWKGKAAKAGYELTMKRASDASSPVRAIGDSLDERFGDRGGATSCHGNTRYAHTTPRDTEHSSFSDFLHSSLFFLQVSIFQFVCVFYFSVSVFFFTVIFYFPLFCVFSFLFFSFCPFSSFFFFSCFPFLFFAVRDANQDQVPLASLPFHRLRWTGWRVRAQLLFDHTSPSWARIHHQSLKPGHQQRKSRRRRMCQRHSALDPWWTRCSAA